MSDPFVAEIRIAAFNFAPSGWAFCNGQVLPISQNTALFSLLGTMYGGDGRSTFALPNLQGSVPIHQGQGPGLSLYDQGQIGGTDAVTLLENEIPTHSHTLNAVVTEPVDSTPEPNVMLGVGIGGAMYNTATALTPMAPTALAVAGSSVPHNNLQPYLVLNFIIAMQGIFPPRT